MHMESCMRGLGRHCSLISGHITLALRPPDPGFLFVSTHSLSSALWRVLFLLPGTFPTDSLTPPRLIPTHPPAISKVSTSSPKHFLSPTSTSKSG